MGVEEDGAAAAAPDHADDVAVLVDVDVVIAHSLHLLGDDPGAAPLLAGAAGGLDHPLQEGDQFLLLPLGEG